MLNSWPYNYLKILWFVVIAFGNEIIGFLLEYFNIFFVEPKVFLFHLGQRFIAYNCAINPHSFNSLLRSDQISPSFFEMATHSIIKWKIPTVDKCCCCIALQTGGVILGVIEIITRFHDICKMYVKGIGVTIVYDPSDSVDTITEPDPLWDEEVLDIMAVALNCTYIWSKLSW